MPKALATLCGLSVVGGLVLASALPIQAARRAEMEKSLLGIRVLESYRAVLAKYGQPTRIYRLDENVQWVPSVDAEGNPTGGVRALDQLAGNTFNGRPGMGGGGRMPGGMSGYPGMMPGGGSPGVSFPAGQIPPGMGPMAGGPPGMSGYPGMMPGGPPGMSGYPGMMPGGMRRPGMVGGPSLPGMAGGGRGLGSNPVGSTGATFANAGGFIWVYFYPKQEQMYLFAFNKDGRIIAIAEYGRDHGKPTSRGLNLGDPVRQVYTSYGWPDTIEQQGDAIALHYNIKHHIQCNIVNNRVTMVAVFLTEDQSIIGNAGSGGRAPGPFMGPGQAMRPGLGMGAPGMGGGKPVLRPGVGGGGGGATSGD